MWRKSKTFMAVGGAVFLLLLVQYGATLLARQAATEVPPALTAAQLDDLVAPLALYPDPLLSQVLVASTYPLEIIEAAQWLQRNPSLTGTALTAAAQQQNWDPSVQALVVFPDLLRRLSEDVTWLVNIGNAFLSQEADVMDAVQRMRAKAQQSARLTSNAQQTVTTTTDTGQTVITIAPAQPNIIYVPVYDPVWVWGPYVWWPYPRWHYPPPGIGVVVIFGPPVIITNFLPGPWFGWSAWGWYPAWGTHVVMFDTVFVHRYNFNPLRVATIGGPEIWRHDAFHRQGIPYPNRLLTEQYRAGARENLRPRVPFEARPAPPTFPQQHDRIGSRQIPVTPPNRNHGAFGGIESGGAAQRHIERGNSSLGARPNPGQAPSHGAPPAHGRHTGVFQNMSLVEFVREVPVGFPNPDEALQAIVQAAAENDTTALLRLFGPGSEDIVQSGDAVEDTAMRAEFVRLAREKISIHIDATNGNKANATIGNQEWPFPIPLIRINGSWQFDLARGRAAIIAHRIGENESDTIEVCRGFVEAEFDYAAETHDGASIFTYTQSMAAGLVPKRLADATVTTGDEKPTASYHGYYFRILKAQGPNARGGAFEYVVDGKMIGGFALIAWPAEYGISGIKTFLVNHDGVVYEKDFGPNTSSVVSRILRFDPDHSWQQVVE